MTKAKCLIQKIENILSTPVGDRLFQPSFGESIRSIIKKTDPEWVKMFFSNFNESLHLRVPHPLMEGFGDHVKFVTHSETPMGPYMVLKIQDVTFDIDIPENVLKGAEWVYNLTEDYVGEKPFGEFLLKNHINPQIIDETHGICTIGKSDDDKWWGWSHRSGCGFGIGDKLFIQDDYSYMGEHTPFVQGGKTTIETLDQAKQAAINFARYVS